MTIDYKKLAVLLLPTYLRQPVIIAMVRTLITPLQTLHDQYKQQRQQRRYRLCHTSQICSIKQALNDEFQITDYTQGFEIEDQNATGQWVWIYDENITKFNTEQHLLIDNPTYLHDTITILTPTTAFTILTPPDKTLNQTNIARITKIANYYRLASKTFTVKTNLFQNLTNRINE